MTSPFAPDAPPRLHVEALPGEAIVCGIARTNLENSATGKSETVAVISAWLRDNWACNESYDNGRGDADPYDHFEDTHCDGCRYNCNDRDLDWSDLDNQTWEDHDGISWMLSSATADSPCDFGRGNCSLRSMDWPCIAGHDEPEEDGEGEISLGPTRLQARRLLSPAKPWQLATGTAGWGAALQRVRFTADGTLLGSNTLQMCNTYEPYHDICWGGGNTRPTSLDEAADTYAYAESNNDLLSVAAFRRNNEEIKASDHYPKTLSNLLAFELPIGSSDQLGLVAAEAACNPDAFLLLAASGARVKDGLAACLAQWVEKLPLPNGQTFNGWLSEPLAGGQSWLVGQLATTEDATAPEQAFVLLGQINAATAAATPVPTPA